MIPLILSIRVNPESMRVNPSWSESMQVDPSCSIRSELIWVDLIWSESLENVATIFWAVNSSFYFEILKESSNVSNEEDGYYKKYINNIDQIHESAKYYRCVHCDSTFNLRAEITNHMFKEHKGQGDPQYHDSLN